MIGWECRAGVLICKDLSAYDHVTSQIHDITMICCVFSFLTYKLPFSFFNFHFIFISFFNFNFLLFVAVIDVCPHRVAGFLYIK